jgi:hypothetical protein
MAIPDMAQIRSALPDYNTVFKLNPDKPTSEVKLKSAEWQIILQINGKRTIQEIVEIIGGGEENVLPHLLELYQKKLIIPQVAEPVAEKEYVSADFFKKIENVLVGFIGPVAPYVINDVLLEFNEDPEKFAKENIPLLIESISQEILDDAKRVKFQKEMLDYIKRL